MKVHIVHGLPARTSDEFLEKIWRETSHDKAACLRAAEYYNHFYGGTRNIRVLSFKRSNT